MQKKNKNLKNKVIITVGIVTIIVLISIIVIQNVIINNGVEENNYLASGNSNSELLAEYIKKGITIGGITGTLESLDTSDATATASDILSGKTAYADGNKLTGILELLNTSDATATAADILSGKTAYVNGEKVTGTLSGSKYAVGKCKTNYVIIEESSETEWCTVSGLDFTPKCVIVIGAANYTRPGICQGLAFGVSPDFISIPSRLDNAGYFFYDYYVADYVYYNMNFESWYGGFRLSADELAPDLDYTDDRNQTTYIALGI